MLQDFFREHWYTFLHSGVLLFLLFVIAFLEVKLEQLSIVFLEVFVELWILLGEFRKFLQMCGPLIWTANIMTNTLYAESEGSTVKIVDLGEGLIVLVLVLVFLFFHIFVELGVEFNPIVLEPQRKNQDIYS